MSFTLSGVLLAIYLFLTGSSSLGWFSVDPKLIGYTAIATVVVFVIEVIFSAQGRPVSIPLFRHRAAPVE